MTKSGYTDGLMLIGGEMVESVGGEWIESINPADETPVGRCPRGTTADVARAVNAAAAAQPAWAALPMAERIERLEALMAVYAQHIDEIAELEARDTGNTFAAMRADVRNSIARVRFISGLAYELKGDSIPATPNGFHFTVREPYGVVARLLPFNHPLMFAINAMVAPLISGNTLIEKPSEHSPLSTSLLGKLSIGILPPGVLNIVTGYGLEVGDAIARHPRIKRMSIVGSARAGMAVQAAAAQSAVKHVTLECGGKNPLIVFEDANYERAVAATVKGMNFNWQSQSCSSTSRAFVHRKLYDRFVDDVVKRVNDIRVGHPMDPESQMGCLNSRAHYQKVMDYIHIGQAEGARLAAGGERPDGEQFSKGFWVRPTVFADVQPTMRIAREEIFGPVLSILPWDDPEEMIRDANGIDLGLTASVWSQDIDKALRTAKRIEAGFVWVNAVSDKYRGLPYGGYKNSGTGREFGLEELMSYTEEKTINILLANPDD